MTVFPFTCLSVSVRVLVCESDFHDRVPCHTDLPLQPVCVWVCMCEKEGGGERGREREWSRVEIAPFSSLAVLGDGRHPEGEHERKCMKMSFSDSLLCPKSHVRVYLHE